MTTPKLLAIALTMAATTLACGPKADHANPPDVTGPACTEEAKVCDDGSSVGRQGPDCEFAACPGELADPEPTLDGEPEPEPADAESAPDAEAADEEASE